MTKLTRLVAILVGSMVLNGSVAAADPPQMSLDIMKPVNSVIAAMNSHDSRTLSNVYTNDAVIVDNQAPFEWSGSAAPSDWLSAMTTYGKLRFAHFDATRDPMDVQIASQKAYVIVLGTLDGFGQHHNLQQHGTMTFSLREVDGNWKIATQSWTLLMDKPRW